MSPELLLGILTASNLTNLGVIILIILSVIQISPIKINPWSWIAKKLGKALNGEITDAIKDMKNNFDELKQDVTNLRKEIREDEAVKKRQAILRFGDEILIDKKHTKEHFDEILEMITDYEFYCKNNPNFKNNKTQMTVERIKEVYKDRLKKNDFLT